MVDGKLAYSVLQNDEEKVILSGKVVAGPFKKTEYLSPVREIGSVKGEIYCAAKTGEQINIYYQDRVIPFAKGEGSYLEQLLRAIA